MQNPSIWITVQQHDPALEGREIMSCRKVLIGDLNVPGFVTQAGWYFEDALRELVYERRRVLADGNDMSEQKREYSRDEPVALDDRDPGNTEPDELTAPLDHDDNVYSLVRPDQGDLREVSPAAEWDDDERYGH